MKRAIAIVLSVILICSGIFLGMQYYFDMRRAQRIYGEIDEKYTDYDHTDGQHVIVVNDEPEEEDATEMIGSSLTDDGEQDDARTADKEPVDSITYSYRYDGPWENQIDVDIVTLTAQYPDVKGWLFFENEDISYPIVQGVSDDQYIRTSYDGKSTRAGSIFMESLNSADFTDAHTIIYGHNMKNRTMFGSLRNYVNHPKYYDYHKYFQIITVSSDGHVVKNRYKVFAYGKTKSFSNVYTICKNHDADFTHLLQYIQGNSTVSTDVPVYETDSIVTLSTCSSGENRLAVSAVKVDEVVY